MSIGCLDVPGKGGQALGHRPKSTLQTLNTELAGLNQLTSDESNVRIVDALFGMAIIQPYKTNIMNDDSSKCQFPWTLRQTKRVSTACIFDTCRPWQSANSKKVVPSVS